ncbi:DNA topoisomerase 2 [Rhodotorula toruloides]|uniref:DNA topoisomerase 2 n=1 Tax=Rhodotorula toruloides TaxID=5286 RepID=A0A2T0A801_RHOTO|nr:DNA topoisomerase 2 [Rhodotorula toruloides]PRQ74133.1 DNA topoisomerase 2 [Rhodotorula toruloides]
MPRYASSDEEDDFHMSDSGSDFEGAGAGKKGKKAALKPAPKKTPAATKKAPAAKKTTTTVAGGGKGKGKKVAAPLEEIDTNGGRGAASDEEEMEEDAMEEDDDDDFDTGKKAPAKGKGKAKSASETYVKLTQLEHVLKRPDTYIGSIEPVTQPMWVWDRESEKMVFRQTTFTPGFYKIFDEILVNAADNKVRDPTMSEIRVTIDEEKRTITVKNDGKGIPIEKHKKEGIYIPELIFGNLLTSSNYDDDEAKTTGGRNGYGAKLANIYSTEFIVETADGESKYRQVFSDNMSRKGAPKITSVKKDGEQYTLITFTPDLERFNMHDGFDRDTLALLHKRVWDMAGIVPKVKVYLNGKVLRCKDFKAYVEKFLAGTNEITGAAAAKKKGKKGEAPVTAAAALFGDEEEDADMRPAADADAAKQTVVFEKVNDRWDVAFAVSDGQFQQVSYCNAIATTKGGSHVTYVADQIVQGLVDLVKKKHKGVQVKPFQIKNHIALFVNCKIDNPSFDSQTKENMTLGVKKFGSKCQLSDEFLKKVAKSGVIDNIVNWAKFKQDQALKKTDGSKRSRITGLVKLEDANNAGTRNGNKCTLILTEGDSAKALAVSGLAVVGRDNYGVFPLRGKLLNVREATGKALLENAEIQAIKQIMGLQQGKTYTSTDSLRYGSLMIMADQDHDGSHIKGLIINFLDYWFPSLLKLPNFLVEFITPIVKVSKGKKEISFFTIPEYEAWKAETDDGRGWKIKYFKGLGTSDTNDAKKYFSDMNRHRLPFKELTPEDRALIDMAFNKKKADDRKEWLRGFVPGTYMDHDVDEVPIKDFINKELILFSMADNIRSIPSVVDGFKPGQRKVLFGCFKRKLKNEIKVGQLSGYISEHSAYHHGDASLQGTIVGLAQNFVGSNNINVLDPNGQFGTRLQGGKDAASARYIFTNVAQITRTLFHPSDDAILDYLNDDGQSIEPSWYIPILPMVLVNGSDGIGTGWSSFIPNFNPSDIVANLRRKLDGEEMEPIHPWYRGFRGTIEKDAKEGYKCTGTIQRIDDSTVEITELPIRTWTQNYKEMLESWVAGSDKQAAWCKDYKEYHTDTTVHFVVTLTTAGKEAIEKDGLEKVFKVTSKLNTSNMVCFDPTGKIKKYATAEDIVSDFYDVRLEFYHKRKKHLVSELELVHDRLSNQARFIKMIIDKQLVLSNRKRADIVAELRKKGFRPFPKVQKMHVAGDVDANGDGDEEVEDPEAVEAGADSDYDYLLNMQLSSLTREKVERLMAERDQRSAELDALLKRSVQDLWRADLDAFMEKWDAMLEEDRANKARSLKKAKSAGKGTAKKRAAYASDDDDDFEVKPKKKAPAPKKAKPAVPLPETDDDEDVVMKAAAKPKAAAAAKPKAPAKRKAASIDLDLSDEDGGAAEKDETPPKKKKATAAAGTAGKKAAASKKKAAASDIEDEDDELDDLYALPAKKPAAHSPKGKKATASKAKAKSVEVDDSDDEPVVAKKKAPAKAKAPPAKKAAAPKKKKSAASDDDDDLDLDLSMSDAPAPKARAARSTRAPAKSYQLDLGSDFEGDESFQVEDDEDEEDAFELGDESE